MSTASEDSSSDPPQRTSHPPGPLAILAATAIGGVLATRLGKAPLIFAAGAAALALLQQKKTPVPPRAEPLRLPPPAPPRLEIPEQRVPPAALPLEIPVESLPPPALPPLEIPVPYVLPAAPQVELPLPTVLLPAPQVDTSAQSLVEQWLARQISREEQAPVVDFSALTAPPREAEEDYRPGSFLLDDGDETSGSALGDIDAFASLTEPAEHSIWVPEPLIADEEPLFEEVEPTFVAAEELFVEMEAMNAEVEEEVPEHPAPPAVADAAWTLGVDPMPSLNEATPQVAPAGGMSFSPGVPQEDASSEPEAPPRSHLFSTAPVQQEETESPLFFATDVFQGAAFPDEIQVAPDFESVPPMPEPPAVEEAPAWAAEVPVTEPPTAWRAKIPVIEQPAAWQAPEPVAEQPAAWRAPEPVAEQPAAWRAPEPVAEQPAAWRAPEPVAEQPAAWRAPEPVAEQPAAWRAPEPVAEQAPAVEAAPEIAVEMAAAGEASFDEPLAAAPTNPWQPEHDGFPMTPPVPAQMQMTGTVVEAEIILRPRAPTQNSVTARAKLAPSNFSNHFADASNDTPPADEAPFPGPLQSQREPKPRTTWRSWWRGD